MSPFEKAAFGENYKIPCSLHEQSIEILHKVKVEKRLLLLAQRLLKADRSETHNFDSSFNHPSVCRIRSLGCNEIGKYSNC